jgi:hypothetical protein
LVVSICKDFAFMNIQPVNFSVIGHPVAVGLLLGLRMVSTRGFYVWGSSLINLQFYGNTERMPVV